MKPVIRTMLWIVAVCGGLQVNPAHTTSRIRLLQRDIKCPSDSTFYTPVNVKEQCLTTALHCVMLELKGTVKDECDDPNNRIDQVLKVLRTKKEELNARVKSRKDCVCEEWPEMFFSNFLNEAKSLVEQVDFLIKRRKPFHKPPKN